MLSERERRTLAEIEGDLAAGSPTLARRLRSPSRTKGMLWAPPIAAAVVGVAMAVLMTALGLPGQAFVIAVLFAWPLGRRLGVRRVRRSTRGARLRFPKPQH